MYYLYHTPTLHSTLTLIMLPNIAQEALFSAVTRPLSIIIFFLKENEQVIQSQTTHFIFFNN